MQDKSNVKKTMSLFFLFKGCICPFSVVIIRIVLFNVQIYDSWVQLTNTHITIISEDNHSTKY